MPEQHEDYYGFDEKMQVKKTRRCHDCGKPTANYRCTACWEKIRGHRAGDNCLTDGDNVYA